MTLDPVIANVLAVLGLFGTVVSIGLAFVFYHRGQHDKHLELLFWYADLQTKSHPDIEISYKGRAITNLSRFLVGVFNGGADEIRKADFGNGTPPQLRLRTDATLLSFKVIKTSSGNSTIHVTECDDGQSLAIQFEYLNRWDGCVIDILYDNPQPGYVPIAFDAELIGAKPWRGRRYPLTPVGRLIKGLALAAALAAVLSFMLVAFWLRLREPVWAGAGTASAVVFGVAAAFLEWQHREFISRSSIPAFMRKAFNETLGLAA